MFDMQSFSDLLLRLRAGDVEAAETIVRDYGPLIRIAIRTRLTDPKLRRHFDSEDVCQSVMASFLARAACGAVGTRGSGWFDAFSHAHRGAQSGAAPAACGGSAETRAAICRQVKLGCSTSPVPTRRPSGRSPGAICSMRFVRACLLTSAVWRTCAPKV